LTAEGDAAVLPADDCGVDACDVGDDRADEPAQADASKAIDTIAREAFVMRPVLPARLTGA
jgi:hypothetical protein